MHIDQSKPMHNRDVEDETDSGCDAADGMGMG